MSYNVGDKVNILANEGQVGTIIDRVADFIYLVGLTESACSWNEEFHEDELSQYENNTGRLWEKFKQENPEAYNFIVAEWKRKEFKVSDTNYTKYLGKINKVKFGLVGYQEAMFGLSLDFSFDGSCGIGTTITGGWYNGIKCTEHCKWTEEDRNAQRAEMCEKVCQLLIDAKVEYVDQLQGKPVELTMDGNCFKDFRILTEVL